MNPVLLRLRMRRTAFRRRTAHDITLMDERLKGTQPPALTACVEEGGDSS
jgi:hypothetical protein